MDDQPRDDIAMESMGNGAASMDATNYESRAGDAEDIEVEVVLVSNDEVGGEYPRTLTDSSGSAFRWYMVAPGVLAAGVAGVLLLHHHSEGGVSGMTQTVQNRASGAMQSLGSVSEKLGSLPNIKGVVQKAAPPPPKSQWEQSRDALADVVNDNMVTIVAIAASLGLTVAGRLVDGKRESSAVELPPVLVQKPWYRGGLWS